MVCVVAPLQCPGHQPYCVSEYRQYGLCNVTFADLKAVAKFARLNQMVQVRIDSVCLPCFNIDVSRRPIVGLCAEVECDSWFRRDNT